MISAKVNIYHFLLRKKNIMITYCLSPDCVVIFLAHDDAVDLRRTVSSCLNASGCRVWKDIEAELYQTRSSGGMIIARPASPRRLRLSVNSPRLSKR